ncbi:MAG: class II aldolase/adducin family protein [Thaumarchaeota archaeon]|nr:class II aldolase/adducin family protein [Nitrososphaerota archaeon]
MDELIRRVAVANRVLGYWYAQIGSGMFEMHLGHVSARIEGERSIYIRGRPQSEDALVTTHLADIVKTDLEGKKTGGEPTVALTGETRLHTCVYSSREDVGGVCHAHPRFLILASDLGLRLKPMMNEGIDSFPVSVYNSNAMISTEPHMQGLVAALGKGKACMLRGHGAVTVGANCEEAVIRMIQLEEQARLNYLAFAASGPGYGSIPEDQAASLRQSIVSSIARTNASPESQRRQAMHMNLWEYLASQVGEPT